MYYTLNMPSSDKILTIPNVCLLYQFIGTLLLGWALATTSIDAITKLASSYWRFSKPVTESLVNQRTDAQCGVAILALGIIFQFLENIFVFSEKSCSKCLVIFSGGFLVFLLIVYPFVRVCICTEIAKQVEQADTNKNQPSSIPPSQ
jgi:hypothetical protein